MDDELLSRKRAIRMLLFDVDGVLTDGTFERRGNDETKRFHSRDGIGLVLARRAGLKTGFISGRRSSAVEARARELHLDFVRLGVEDKVASLEEALDQESLQASQVAYMGDDLPDLAVLSRVGFSATVSDAPPEVRSRVDYVTRARGGYGAVRELVEEILTAMGRLDELVRAYTR
ncbi:MAG TPA: HAD hydrolase family protein [Vicinamibacteria bacterium]|nr:HAD hydrolase family protein [Vicinamibacteria bacterium]